MVELLLFFAIPLAVVVYSIALQKILRCPFLVSGIIFVTFLIIVLVLNNMEYLIAVIIYTIISFITAYVTMIIHRYKRENSSFNPMVTTLNKENFNNSTVLLTNENSTNNIVGRCNRR